MTHRPAPHERIYVALDTPSAEHALRLTLALAGKVGGFKIGLELFASQGPAIVERVAAHGDVFVDLKLHDIPNTVSGATTALTRAGVRWLTVHASGGEAMIRRAVDAARHAAAPAQRPPGILAVTVLTSLDELALDGIGMRGTCASAALRLAAAARGAGADGVVCSPHEVGAMRDVVGDGCIVVPGIRPRDGSAIAGDDQSRTADPRSAIDSGADLLVVGRPITAATDPVDAVRRISASIEGAPS